MDFIIKLKTLGVRDITTFDLMNKPQDEVFS